MMVQGFSPLASHRNLVADPTTTATIPTAARRRLVAGGPYPDALPAPGFYERHPEKVGPLANVLVTDSAALAPWLLVARPVSRAEAKASGGCIMFNPTLNKAEGQQAIEESQYYCITDTDDEVYGRATYLPRSETVKKGRGLASSSYSSNSRDCCCTEEAVSEPTSPLRRNVSYEVCEENSVRIC